MYWAWTGTFPRESKQFALLHLETIGEELGKSSRHEDVEMYQSAQTKLWQELRVLGNPWLVTDLITVGSPLAHAAFLLAHEPGELRARQRQRELPTNPPVADEVEANQRRYSYRVWEKYEGDVELRALHHAGLFACTRWHNIFFPVKWGLFGDIIGGPLQPWFGSGIQDIAVWSNSWLRRHTILGHISYWQSEQEPSPLTKPPIAISALINALDLEEAHTLCHFDDGTGQMD